MISTTKHWLQAEVHYWCVTVVLFAANNIRASPKRTSYSITHLHCHSMQMVTEHRQAGTRAGGIHPA